MSAGIRFTSVLGKEHHDELEQLLFFNPQQSRALAGINHAIHDYGAPSIVTEDGRLRVKVDGPHDTQTLFALHPNNGNTDLVGVAVYCRPDPENIVLLHIAVRQEYSRSGQYGDKMLVPQFMGQLRDVGRRIKGVRNLTTPYAPGLVLDVGGA